MSTRTPEHKRHPPAPLRQRTGLAQGGIDTQPENFKENINTYALKHMNTRTLEHKKHQHLNTRTR